MGAGAVGGLSQARSGRVRASARQPAAALGRRAASRGRSSQAAPLGCGPVATVSIPARGSAGCNSLPKGFDLAEVGGPQLRPALGPQFWQTGVPFASCSPSACRAPPPLAVFRRRWLERVRASARAVRRRPMRRTANLAAGRSMPSRRRRRTRRIDVAAVGSPQPPLAEGCHSPKARASPSARLRAERKSRAGARAAIRCRTVATSPPSAGCRASSHTRRFDGAAIGGPKPPAAEARISRPRHACAPQASTREAMCALARRGAIRCRTLRCRRRRPPLLRAREAGVIRSGSPALRAPRGSSRAPRRGNGGRATKCSRRRCPAARGRT